MLTVAPVSRSALTVGNGQHFHVARPKPVDDGERESPQNEATPVHLDHRPSLGSFSDTKQGPLELGQERLGGCGVSFALPASSATRFFDSTGVKAES